MKTVVYIDVLLLVNFIIALFLLLTAGVLAGQICGHWRLCLGGGVAALSTLVLFAPELPFVVQLLYQGGTAILVVGCAYGRTARRVFAKLVGWYFVLNLLLAGVVTGVLLRTQSQYHGAQTNNLSVYLYLSPTVLICCVMGVYLALKLLLHCCGTPNTAPPQSLVVVLGGKSVNVQAFYDTGCALHDPFSDKRVLLLSLPALQGQLPSELYVALLEAQSFVGMGATMISAQGGNETQASPTYAIRYLSCQTVAGENLLPAIRADCVYCIDHPDRKITNILVAFAKELSFCEGCNALFGSELAEDLIVVKKGENTWFH